MLYNIDGGFTAGAVAKITGGALWGHADTPVPCFTCDSRDKNIGGLFVAIKGERFDGHDFIREAASNGAACCLVSRPGCDAHVPTGILVGDTVAALGALANAHRRRINPVTVAVTGSVGKTTTKQFIYSVLCEAYDTHKTEGNLNNEIGLPITLLQLREQNKASVLEFGMSGRGEIRRLSLIAEPDVAVITNIGSSHIEYLGSREAIRDAKMEIADGLRRGGRLFLNGDEPLLSGIAGAVYVSFDKGSGADIIVEPAASDTGGSLFDITAFGQRTREVKIPVIGRHNIYNAAVAFGVGIALGMRTDDIRKGLLKFKNTGMRQNIIKSGGITIIEDCYNAGPESMASSLSVLSSVSRHAGGRGIAVLGDMRELGAWSEKLHRDVGRLVAETRTELLFTFGEDALFIADGAKKAGMDPARIFSFCDISDPVSLVRALKDVLRGGDVVLFKASRAVELERVVSEIKDPNNG